MGLEGCATAARKMRPLDGTLGPHNPLLVEIQGYHELWLSMSSPHPVVPQASVARLLPPCLAGSRRLQKILAALGCIFGNHPGEVPGLDLAATHLIASLFFLEADDLSTSALVLGGARWSLPQSYLVAGLIMLAAGHLKPAVSAFEMGAGMGNDACISHCASFAFLAGDGSSSTFAAMHRGAERGFAVPLAAASAALSLGAGVDRDDRLAAVYMSMAKRSFLPAWLGDEIRRFAKANSVATGEIIRGYQGSLAILLNWASKHQNDPVYLLAAREWQRINSQKE